MGPEEGLATKKDLERVEQTLGEKIDANSNKIDTVEKTLSEKIDTVEKTLSAKIEENSKKIDTVEKTLSRKIDRNSKKIDRVERTLSAKIDANSGSINRLTIQVIKNSEAIDKMVTREEFDEFRSDIFSGLDKIMAILTRLDQERIFTTEWIRGIEGDVQNNKREIDGIKVRLAIS